MKDELPQALRRLFWIRSASAEKLLGLSAEDAASLLVQIFERATTPEVLALLHAEYGYTATRSVTPQPKEDSRRTEQAIELMERIQATSDPEELLAVYETAAAEGAIREVVVRRLKSLYQGRIEAAAVSELTGLAHALPRTLPAALKEELLASLCRRWEQALEQQGREATNAEDMQAVRTSLAALWLLCERLNLPGQPVERAFTRMVLRWLELLTEIASGDSPEALELPPQLLEVDDEPKVVLSDPELKEEVNQAWEQFVSGRVAAAGDSLQALKNLYESQDWEQHYRPARRLILNPWNSLTAAALEQAKSFEEMGEVVRRGGGQAAIKRWIDKASDWEEVKQICTSVDPNSRRGRHYNQLVEKILVFADSEEKIREAHSLLRSHALSRLMGK